MPIPYVPDLCMLDSSTTLCGLSLGRQSIEIRARTRMKWVHQGQDAGSGQTHKVLSSVRAQIVHLSSLLEGDNSAARRIRAKCNSPA